MDGRVLIIEDHQGNRNLIRERLEAEGLQVAEAATAEAGLQRAVRSIPQAILLGTSLPDIGGLDVVRRLRRMNRTKHIFVMLIGDEDNRNERLDGLEAGANDFVVNPVDADLAMLRIRNAIRRANLENRTDPVTGMPAGRGVQDQLMQLVRDPDGSWALIRLRIRNLVPFREVHGFMAGDDLLRGVARILAEVLGRDDVDGDYLGSGGHDDFIVVTSQERAEPLMAEVKAQFEAEIGSYYGFFERRQGFIEFEGQEYPLASLRTRQVVPGDGPFYDIRSLSEVLAG